jgi:hypothetical protein
MKNSTFELNNALNGKSAAFYSIDTINLQINNCIVLNNTSASEGVFMISQSKNL